MLCFKIIQCLPFVLLSFGFSLLRLGCAVWNLLSNCSAPKLYWCDCCITNLPFVTRTYMEDLDRKLCTCILTRLTFGLRDLFLHTPNRYLTSKLTHPLPFYHFIVSTDISMGKTGRKILRTKRFRTKSDVVTRARFFLCANVAAKISLEQFRTGRLMTFYCRASDSES